MDINYKDDWSLIIGQEGKRFWLQVRCDGVNNQTGKNLEWGGRKWMLSQHMTRSEIVQTAFKAIMTAEEHELREKFLYQGHAIFGPHFNVEFLVENCNQVKKNPLLAAGVYEERAAFVPK